ncbi:unnamed protein product [Absidia cylindrospora]
MPSRTATLRQENDTYFANWALSDGVLSYEGVKGNVQEMDCLLIFDEETQTFTIERPSLKTTLKKSKKPTHSTSSKKNATNRKGKLKPTPSSSSTTKSDNNGKEAQKQTSPISLALPQQKPKDTQGTATSPTNDNSDSFDDDILRDMDEILNSNDDDDDDDNNEFETITTPHMSNDSMQIDNVPLSISPRPVATSSPGSQQQPSTPGNRRRQVLKMASAPIRRLDSSPPTPAPTLSSPSAAIIPPASQPPSLSNKRPRTSGKTISAETLAERRKAASAIRSDSSSGSSSSGSDSSSDDDGSGSSGSSGSESDDDHDMDLLAANISQGLSENETRQPTDGTPNQLRFTPNGYDSTLTPTSNRGSNNATPGPTSLRDLLGKGDQRDDDDVSSSGSSDDDDG